MSEFIGTIVSGFQIIELLDDPDHQPPGRASDQTATFLAEQPGSGSYAVVRAFPESLSASRPRLQQLSQSLAVVRQLSHPAVLKPMGSATLGGRACILLPFIPAGGLDSRLLLNMHASLDAGEVIDQIAGALSQAHGKGIVHAALKPSKVLFDEEGSVYLAGLGEAPARNVTPDSQAWELSPEQRRGEAPTPASDQFGLAVLAFQLFSGYLTDQAVAELSRLAQEAKDPRPHSQPSSSFGLPRVFLQALLKAMSDDPDARFESIGAMNRALQVALGRAEPEAPKAASQVAQTEGRAPDKRKRRRPVLLFAPLLATVVCLVVTVPAVMAGSFDPRSWLPQGTAPTPTAQPERSGPILLPTQIPTQGPAVGTDPNLGDDASTPGDELSATPAENSGQATATPGSGTGQGGNGTSSPTNAPSNSTSAPTNTSAPSPTKTSIVAPTATSQPTSAPTDPPPPTPTPDTGGGPQDPCQKNPDHPKCTPSP